MRKEKLEEALKTPRGGRNSMGCDERYYDPLFLIGKALEDKGIDFATVTDEQMESMMIVAECASDAFY